MRLPCIFQITALFEICGNWFWCWATPVDWTATPPPNPWTPPDKIFIPVKPPAAGVPLQGIAQPQDGAGNPLPRMFRMKNIGSGPVQIQNLMGSTSVENIATPNGLDYWIYPGDSVDFNYDTTNLQHTCSNGPPVQSPLITDSYSSTVTFDINKSDKHTVTLGGNPTLAVSNVQVGKPFFIELIQGTGGQTVTWWSGITWAGGSAPTLATGAGAKNGFSFFCDGSGTYLGCQFV
jgi:hypothetical protein